MDYKCVDDGTAGIKLCVSLRKGLFLLLLEMEKVCENYLVISITAYMLS